MPRPARPARLRAMRIAAVLLAALPPSGCLTAAEGLAGTPAAAHSFAPHVAEASLRFGIPPNWIWRVMQVESRGNPRALSRAGAMGLMQIMPATWAMLTARHGLGSDPFDARSNILAGAAYLRAMWDRYRDLPLMLAAYNAGPGRADAYAAGRRGLPAETVAYVATIAPTLGASGIASPASAPPPIMHPEAPDWRGAGVFATPAARGAAASGPPAPAQTGDAVAVPVRPANPIFVPLSGRDQ